MKRSGRYRRLLRSLSYYLVFFLLVAFVITCCTMLFVSTLSKSLDITFTDAHIATAAKLTFWNVVLLSLILSVFDRLRRKLMVERPIKRINEAADKMIQGDFSVRVQKLPHNDDFNEIIDCFNKMAEELSGTETLRTDFIANVSHELKTPLAVMQNYGTLLQQPGLGEEKRLEYAKAITDASRRLADLITNILKLNKLENQQIYPKCAEFDLSEQLCGCLLQFESVWEQQNIEIETEIADSITVRADEELLSLVWNNLLSNAFKFTSPGGKVSVALSATGHHAVVKVQDTGCGMSPEVGAHIFEKFYQGDPSHATQGNGLGLALVKRVVDILRGEISVESERGKGTTFTVKIRRL